MSNFGLSDDEEYLTQSAMAASYDEYTVRVLDDEIKVGPGWQCLEVAAGIGSVATALHDRAGSVTALDVKTIYLDPLASPTFGVVRGDIESTDLGVEYDLVHARFLLDLVSDPRAVMHRMSEAIRPGGWLFLEEFDDITIEQPQGSPRARELHERVVEAKQAAWRTEGHHNHLGRALPDLMFQVGLHDVDNNCGCRLRLSGSPDVFPWRQRLLGMKESLLREGLSDEDFTDYIVVLDQPGFTYFAPLVVRAWGRTPARS